MAAYMLGRHFANSMGVPMQNCSGVLMRCTHFTLVVPDNHPWHLHANVQVVENAWCNDGGSEMLNDLVALMKEGVVALAYKQRISPQGHPRGDPNDSTASTTA